jgi:hypothetical protein
VLGFSFFRKLSGSDEREPDTEQKFVLLHLNFSVTSDTAFNKRRKTKMCSLLQYVLLYRVSLKDSSGFKQLYIR